MAMNPVEIPRNYGLFEFPLLNGLVSGKKYGKHPYLIGKSWNIYGFL
jgi:hypothetical protein